MGVPGAEQLTEPVTHGVEQLESQFQSSFEVAGSLPRALSTTADAWPV